jgi:hypothetical protein
MEHTYIEQADIIDQYLLGKLAEEENNEFEEHFITCSQCTERLQVTQNFLYDLRNTMIEPMLTAQFDDSPGPLRKLWQLFFSKPLVLVSICLLLAALIGQMMQFYEIRNLRTAVSTAEATSSQWQQRYEEEQQANASTDQQHLEKEKELALRIQELESKASQGVKGAANFIEGFLPGTSLSSFVLTSVRSAAQSLPPGNNIHLTNENRAILLSIPLESEGNYRAYRLAIINQQKLMVWKKSEGKPDQFNSFSLLFPTRFFKPGSYLLTIEGLTDTGEFKTVGNYPFRIAKK